MRVLYSLIRLVFYYFLFLFAFKAVASLVKLFFHRSGRYREGGIADNDNGDSHKDKFDYKNVVDAEFKEIKK